MSSSPREQIRWGQKPDGVCLVVGACNRGFDPASNSTGDLIFTTEVRLEPLNAAVRRLRQTPYHGCPLAQTLSTRDRGLQQAAAACNKAPCALQHQ